MQLPQHHEVVALKQHVAELRERESTLKSCLYAVLGEHVAHREVFPGVAQEVNEPKVAQPTEVIQQQRTAFPLKVNKIGELCANSGTVVIQRRPVQ